MQKARASCKVSAKRDRLSTLLLSLSLTTHVFFQKLKAYWLKVKSGRDISSPAKRTRTVSSDDSLTQITDFTLTNLEDEEQDLKDQESKHARYNNFAYCNSSSGGLSDEVESFADIEEEDHEDDDEDEWGNPSVGEATEEQFKPSAEKVVDMEEVHK